MAAASWDGSLRIDIPRLGLIVCSCCANSEDSLNLLRAECEQRRCFEQQRLFATIDQEPVMDLTAWKHARVLLIDLTGVDACAHYCTREETGREDGWHLSGVCCLLWCSANERHRRAIPHRTVFSRRKILA